MQESFEGGRTARCLSWGLVLFAFVVAAAPGRAQTQEPKSTVAAGLGGAPNVRAIRQQLIELLRLTPTLGTIVARDPSLLNDQQYISHNNPRLMEFLQMHPEIAHDPEAYLYPPERSGSHESRQSQQMHLAWELSPESVHRPSIFSTPDLGPFFIFGVIVGALLWLVRVLLENRRWSQASKIQTEIQNKLLDKFGTEQELLAYLQSEAGRRFLESPTLPPVSGPSAASRTSRILTPLQIGVVITLIGGAFLYLYYLFPEVSDSRLLLTLGILALAVGAGLIISAGFAWGLARRLALFSTDNAEARTSGAKSAEGC